MSFPIGITLKDVQAAISGADEFKVVRKDDYIVVNYLVNFETTFPIIKDRNDAIRRECRGLIFDLQGNCISRPYHKFFNIGERQETQSSNIDWTQEHVVLEKLDGSFIRPFRVNGKLLWGTKMGVTDVSALAEQFVRNRSNYIEFAEKMIDTGKTAVFEFCSRAQRIVIDYEVERLVLTAVRDINTGEYMRYNDMVELANSHNIEVVQAFESVSDFETFLNKTRGLVGMEGYVVRFKNEMYKIKADEYCLLHKTLDKLQREKDFIQLIVGEKLDDVLGQLKADIAEKITKFSDDFNRNVAKLADKLWWDALASYDNMNGSRKRFAEWAQTQGQYSDILFKAFDYMDGDRDQNQGVDYLRGVILNKINSQCSTQTKVNGVRYLFGGINWVDYYRATVDLDG